MNILVLNGPNLNMLGKREPEVYGKESYDDLQKYLQEVAKEYAVSIEEKQSNLEGILIDILHYADDMYDAVIFNAGAFTHYSYALYDAIKSISIPVVEVHLSDITKREEFRKKSVIKDACVTTYMGEGFLSYKKGILYVIEEGAKK